MSHLHLDLATSPGCRITICCEEAVRTATHLQLNVRFEFNGVTCIARPGDTAAGLERAWRKALDSDGSIKVAVAG